MIEHGLVGFEPSTALQPWYFLSASEAFSVSERWPKASERSELYAFARRQDCDDVACFARDPDGGVEVVVVHAWTSEGYEVLARHRSIWEWWKHVVDDIAEWVDLSDE